MKPVMSNYKPSTWINTKEVQQQQTAQSDHQHCHAEAISIAPLNLSLGMTQVKSPANDEENDAESCRASVWATLMVTARTCCQ